MEWRKEARSFESLALFTFGSIGMLLASLGVYGLVSYAVAQRRTELGVRLALGARPEQVSWLVLRQGMTPVMRRLFAGIVVAFVLSRVIASMLFGVSAQDPATICGVVILFAGVPTLACWIPAARTMRIDPMEALRYE